MCYCYRLSSSSLLPTSMASLLVRKYLKTGNILTLFSLIFIVEMVFMLYDRLLYNASVCQGEILALRGSLSPITYNISDLYASSQYGAKLANGLPTSQAKYPIFILSKPENTEHRRLLREIWSKPRDRVTSKSVHKNQLYDLYFLLDHLDIHNVTALKHIAYENILHADVFHIQPEIDTFASELNRTVQIPTVMRSLMFAGAISHNAVHFIVAKDTTFLNINNILSLLDLRGMNWSVYAWFHSVRGQQDNLKSIDTSVFAISADLSRALTRMPLTNLAYNDNDSMLFDLLLQLKARIIPENGFLTGHFLVGEPATTVCDAVRDQVLSRAGLTLFELDRLWSTLKHPYPKCRGTSDRLSFWNYFKVRERHQWTYNKTALIENKNMCLSSFDIIIMVHSHIEDFQNRSITRNTWASPTQNIPWPVGTFTMNAKVLFVLGRLPNETLQNQVYNESNYYNDILQGDFEEKYTNLAVKHTFGFAWIAKYCNNVKYVLKADDDVIVNLPYLEHVIKIAPLRRSIIGSVRSCPWRGPERTVGDKWEIDISKYPLSVFPIYMPGSSYLTTMDIVEEFANIAENMTYIRLDDVFFTGILARVIGVNHIYWPEYRNRYAAYSVVQNSPWLACQIAKNHWIDTFFMEKNRAEFVWKVLPHANKQDCDDLAKMATASDTGSINLINALLLTIAKVLAMVSLIFCIVCCKTGCL